MFMGASSPIYAYAMAARKRASSGNSIVGRVSIAGIVAQVIEHRPEQPARLLRRRRWLFVVLSLFIKLP
jgi:hypothetical protein